MRWGRHRQMPRQVVKQKRWQQDEPGSDLVAAQYSIYDGRCKLTALRVDFDVMRVTA